MTIEEKLQQVPKLSQEIRAKTEAIQKNRSLAEKTTASIMTTCTKFTGVNTHKVEEVVEKLMELEADLIDSLTELTELQRWAVTLIDQLEDSTQRTILTERYINNKEWKVIAADMCLTEVRVLQIRAEAVKKLCQRV